MRKGRDLGRLSAAAGAGLGVGVATSYLQGVLPRSANFLANSGAVWSVVAFLAAWAFGRRVATSIAAGFVALLGEVVGYYAIACPIRHVAASASERILWTVAAVIIGPLVGYLAWRARHGPAVVRLGAVGAVCGIVAGEGLHALVRLSYAGQGAVECAVALAVLAVASWRLTGAWWPRLAGLAAGAVVALVVFAAYAVG